jgi:hypothetical protein
MLDNTQYVFVTPSLVFERMQHMKGLANLVPGFNFISEHSQALCPCVKCRSIYFERVDDESPAS